MPSFNKITLVGHAGRDPEMRYTPTGTAACSFTVATSEKRKDAEEVTTWFRCTVWGKSAENAQQYIAKGRLVYIEGRLRVSEYTTREGEKRTALEVNVSDWHLLDKREQAQAATAGASADDDFGPF